MIEAWIAHLLHVQVEVSPLDSLDDPDWRWFVGLDAEATRIGNTLWRGEAVDVDTQARIIALFSLRFADPAQVDPSVGNRPAYLLLAMTPQKRVTVKPHNLIAGLPLAPGLSAS